MTGSSGRWDHPTISHARRHPLLESTHQDSGALARVGLSNRIARWPYGRRLGGSGTGDTPPPVAHHAVCCVPAVPYMHMHAPATALAKACPHYPYYICMYVQLTPLLRINGHLVNKRWTPRPVRRQLQVAILSRRTGWGVRANAGPLIGSLFPPPTLSVGVLVEFAGRLSDLRQPGGWPQCPRRRHPPRPSTRL